MSDTPRTDALADQFGLILHPAVMAYNSLARELEREVNAERSAVYVAAAAITLTDPVIDKLKAENDQLRAMLGPALEDGDLIDAWGKSPGFLIGKTHDGRWQAACQAPGLVGNALVDSNLRGLLMQVRAIQQ